MSDEAAFAKAYQAVGGYFCAFSALDRELGETIKVIFRLQQHEAADTIVAALRDVARKTGLVRAAVQMAKNADGSETPDDWKEEADKTMRAILTCNNEDRVLLAHSYLEPLEDGSVKFTRLHLPDGVFKARQETWIENDFKNKVGRLSDLIQQLQGVKRDLSKLRVAVPNWMVQDPYQPMRRGLVPGTDTADTASHSVK